jgi:hypothetical protein
MIKVLIVNFLISWKEYEGIVMADIEVRKINESTVFVASENTRILKDINCLFSVYAEQYRWSPKFKAKIWDGKIRFFDYNNQLPIGLVPKLERFAKEGNYSIVKHYNDGYELSKEDFMSYVESLNLQSGGVPIEPRDFQLKAAYEAITKTKLTIDSSTGSGKSLVLYLIVRYLYEVLHKKIFVIVPTVALTNQLVYDFMDYGWDTCEDKICTVYAGQTRIMTRPIILSTWQSLYDGEEVLQTAEILMMDECFPHSTKVNTKNGYIDIDKINIGDEVYSLNLDSNQRELKTVSKIYKNATLSTHLVEIEIDNGNIIKCTPNHKFYVKQDNICIQKMASELTDQDELVEFEGYK